MKRRDFLKGFAAVGVPVVAGAEAPEMDWDKLAEQSRPPPGYQPPLPPQQLPDVPLPSQADVQAALARITQPPRMPAAGKLGLWIWYQVGVAGSETFLCELQPIISEHAARLDVQYFAVLQPLELAADVSFESPCSKTISATPDVFGRTADAYADGNVPAIVVVSEQGRQLVSVGQLKMLLRR